MHGQFNHIGARIRLMLCLTASLLLVGCGRSEAARPGVSVVIASGEPAPGLEAGFRFGGTADHYAMSASGHLIFTGHANLKDGDGSTRIDAVWFGKLDSLRPVARVGDALPAAADDATVSGFSPRPMIVTRDGTAVFAVQMTRRTVNAASEALLLHHEGDLRTVVATGDEVPGPNGAGQLQRINQFVATDAGVLLMGSYARRQTALWFWDFSTLQLVAADRGSIALGDAQCQVRSLASTRLDINADGVAVFRVSLGGNGCPRQAVVAWDADESTFKTVASARAPIAPGADESFQSLTGDARIGDDGAVALHANVYLASASNRPARELTLLQAAPGEPSVALIDKETPIPAASELTLTHTIHDDGMAIVGERELVHFVRSNRDRVLLRTTRNGDLTHALIARTGSTIGEHTAARIGNAQVNRDGDVVFTSFIDDGPTGGIYQQELWHANRAGALARLAYAGQPVVGRDGVSIERIDTGSQSHEPTAANTQGGQSRRISDGGQVMFSGRLKKGTQWHDALFVARFD